MKLTTRLLLAILPIVLVVMGTLGLAFAAERDRVLEPALQQQTRSYARALDIAFEYGLRDMGNARISAFLERLIVDPRVFGARLYDPDGSVRFASSSMTTSPPAPDSVLRLVLNGAAEATFENTHDGLKVFTVLRAVREPGLSDDPRAALGAVTGVLEVAQPYSAMSSEVRRLQRELVVATLVMLMIVTAVIGITARRFVARPLQRLVVAARALGEGDIAARVPDALGAAEPNALAREFNVMADRLAAARADVVREGEERVRLERKLLESEKLASVGTLAAGLAHEIGAPLNVISGRAELLLRQPAVSPDHVRQLESIVQQSARITRTVRSLLDYARRPLRRDEPVSIGDVIETTLELLEHEFARSQVRVIRHEHYEAWVRGDADQLCQVLTNLLLNAAQAMDGQQTPREVVVGVDTVKSDAGASTARLQWTVTDNGPGLPQALDGRMFTPFATTKSSGTGLGLVVARSIVEDHGGTLLGTTRSDGCTGAVFTVTLPLVSTLVAGDA